ncbi:SH3 domain-binding protein 2-like [Saccostrea echinata]|uniref:SH3 domain-binding protein 2-like n=1 Tax=Saccostrea echinata TaxID=191078 RepID=UPI002A810827|nr:SH3 domain-binding protein 2-like [Saccostrea echinata]XP_061194065.1 SH3 domain-binding protein 2-like [Saccostrea echinata]
MSGGTLNRKKEPLSEPHRHIGAQDLLKQKDSVCHSGFLRSRGKLERIVGSNALFKTIFSELAKWRQRFVIIGRGCLYVYKDEHGRAPLHSVSLKGYSRVERPSPAMGIEVDTRRCFQVVPSEETMKTFIFGCAKDGERKEWMQHIREEMLLANSVTDDGKEISGTESDEYVYLERPVIEKIIQGKSPTRPNVPKRKPPSTPKENDDDTDSDSDYDKIAEDEMKKIRGKPLPAIPPEEVVKRPNKPKKLKPTKSSEDEYVFNDSDREKAIEILSNRGSGTFLVRKSRAGDQQVLSVKTDEGMKEYKIYSKNDGLTIDHRTYFQTVENLIDNYKRVTLPNRTTTLSRGFSVSGED